MNHRSWVAAAAATLAIACLPAAAGAATISSDATSTCQVGAQADLIGDYNMTYVRTTPVCDAATTITIGGWPFWQTLGGWEESGMRLSFDALDSALSTRATITSAELVLNKTGGTGDGFRALVGDVYDAPGYGAVAEPSVGSFSIDVTAIVAAWQASRARSASELPPVYLTEDAPASLLIDGWTWGDNELNSCAFGGTIGCASGAATVSTSTASASARPHLVVTTP